MMTRPSSYLFLLVMLTTALLAAGCRTEGGASLPWTSTWQEAVEQSQATGKPIMIAFTREDVSPSSARIKEEIFPAAAFKTWAMEKVVPLTVNLSAQAQGDRAAKEELAQRFDVLGYPTVVFADAEGKKLGSLRYDKAGAASWVEQADRIVTGRQPAPLPWSHRWEQAAKESLATGKPVMIDFTGSDWCVFCIKLKTEVFDTPAFRSWSEANVVLLEIDFPRNFDFDPKLQVEYEALAGKYGVRGFPTIVFADHTGQPLGSTGYAEGGPEAWLPKAEAALRGSVSQP